MRACSQQELLANRALAAAVGGDEPRRRRCRSTCAPASAACSQQYRDGHGVPFVMEVRRRARRPAERVGRSPAARSSSATIGYWVSERFAGRGITPTAVALATDYCFVELRPAPHGDLHPPRERSRACASSRSSASATRGCVGGSSTSTATGATTTRSRSSPRRCREGVLRRWRDGRVPADVGAHPRRRSRRVGVPAAARRSLNTPAPCEAMRTPVS